MLIDKVFFRINGKLYSWTGWLGCQLESREWLRVPAGTERTLLGEDFRVWRSDRDGLKYRTTWSLINLPENIDKANERIRGLKDKLAKLI